MFQLADPRAPGWTSLPFLPLYFRSLSGTMMMVDFQPTTNGAPHISAPRAVFETGLEVTPGLDQYRVNADGTRFLLRRPIDASAEALNRLEVILNWPGLLKK